MDDPLPTPPTAPVEEKPRPGRDALVISLLLILYPVGLVMMFTMTSWKWWVKLLWLLPLALFILYFASLPYLVTLIQ